MIGTTLVGKIVDYACFISRLRGRFGMKAGMGVAWAHRACTRAGAGMVPVRIPELPGPIYLRPMTSDWKVFWQIFVDEEYSCPANETFPAGLIIDCGANIGCTAVYFASKFPTARIIAIEPDSSNFEMLVLNSRPYTNVQCLKAAVWDHTTKMVIADPAAPKWCLSVQEAGERIQDTIDGITLTSVLGENEEIDILKLDIEGCENQIFAAGYEPWLSRTRRILIELHDNVRPGCSRNFYRAIISRPFSQAVKGEILSIEFTDGIPSEADPPVGGRRPRRPVGYEQ